MGREWTWTQEGCPEGHARSVKGDGGEGTVFPSRSTRH